MINLDKIYDYVVNNEVLMKIESIKNLGFNEDDIEELLDRGIISYIDDSTYKFEDVDGLFNVAEELLKDNKFQEGKSYLKKVLEMDKEHNEAWNRLLFQSIKEQNYEEVFILLDCIPKTEKMYHEHDYIYYLYLMNFITNLPDKYQNYIKFLDFNSIEIPVNDTRFEDRVWQNRIRLLTFNKKFSKALDEEYESLKEVDYITEADMIIKELLKQVVTSVKNLHNAVNIAIRKKDYQCAIEILSRRKAIHGLAVYDHYTLKLLQAYDMIDRLGVIPQIEETDIKTIFDAINAKDYELALKLCEEDGRDGTNNAIHLLLRDICDLIKEQKDINSQFSEQSKALREHKEKSYESLTDEQLISKCRGILKYREDVILLEPMPKNDRKRIHNLITGTDDLATLSIGKSPDRRIIIRRKPIIIPGFDVKKEIDLAKYKFSKKQYADSVRAYVYLLDHLNWPRSNIFSGIAFSYLKQYDIKKAIKYFEIANLMLKEKDSKKDYDSIIENLKSYGASKEKCVAKGINEEDFNANNNHGIENFDSINDYVILTGVSVEEACQKFGLTKEETDTVKLLYAKECFSQNMPEKGENFLRSFERSDCKTPHNIRFLQEIRKNKGLYAKKNDGEVKKLLLTMKP